MIPYSPPLMHDVWIFLGLVIPVILTAAGALLLVEQQIKQRVLARRDMHDRPRCEACNIMPAEYEVQWVEPPGVTLVCGGCRPTKENPNVLQIMEPFGPNEGLD